jgi:ABC-type nitrate/sulfonate/bicarbonate transport system substrate-binding protein
MDNLPEVVLNAAELKVRQIATAYGFDTYFNTHPDAARNLVKAVLDAAAGAVPNPEEKAKAEKEAAALLEKQKLEAEEAAANTKQPAEDGVTGADLPAQGGVAGVQQARVGKTTGGW